MDFVNDRLGLQKLIVLFFFLSGFSFTDTDNSQDNRGREGTIFYSTLPFPLTQPWFGLFTVHLISNNNLCFFINKDRTQVRTKYNVSLLKPYLDSDEKKLRVMKTPIPLPRQSANKHKIMKVDSPSLTDKQILEERIDNYAITNLSNEIIEMILVDAVKFSKNSTEICSRFNSILKQKKDALLTHIHKEFPDSIFGILPYFHKKIKASIQKIMKHLVYLAESQQAWLKLFMIRNRDVHGSSLILTRTHGI